MIYLCDNYIGKQCYSIFWYTFHEYFIGFWHFDWTLKSFALYTFYIQYPISDIYLITNNIIHSYIKCTFQIIRRISRWIAMLMLCYVLLSGLYLCIQIIFCPNWPYSNQHMDLILLLYHLMTCVEISIICHYIVCKSYVTIVLIIFVNILHVWVCHKFVEYCK